MPPGYKNEHLHCRPDTRSAVRRNKFNEGWIEHMNLHEYQAKQLFARYGLPAPVGYACTTPREAEEAASKIGAGRGS
jgi:succinyl-CoA synthetase beta subunit